MADAEARQEKGRGDGRMSRIVHDQWGTLSPPRPDLPPRDTPLPPALRGDGQPDGAAASTDPLARDEATASLEAALFLADEPLPARKLAQVAGLADAAAARRSLKRLQQLYDEAGTPFRVEEIAGGFQLLTRSDYHRWVAGRRQAHEMRLSPAARETLAIVAYRQSLTRADIEAIRGVNCTETLRLLMERGLVKITGRDDSLGRPVLYGTTRKFLQQYGLKSLKDLPKSADTDGGR
jgi:segregation and condensation protein B